MTKKFHRWVVRTAWPVAMCALLFFSCHQRTKNGKALLRLMPVQTPHGWAYRITLNEQPLFYQEYIPAVSGYHSFRSKEDAMRTGSLVMHKLRYGLTPTVNLHELDSLRVLP